MSFRALVYAYVFGGITFIPLLIIGAIYYTIYTSVLVIEDEQSSKQVKSSNATPEHHDGDPKKHEDSETQTPPPDLEEPTLVVDDVPKTRKGWLTVRRTYEEANADGSYVTLVRSLLDARSKDPKRSRPRDMWYVVLKGTVLYLYEDEGMTECEAAVEVAAHQVVVFPEGLPDGELFAKRNAICLKPKVVPGDKTMMPSLTREMKLEDESLESLEAAAGSTSKKRGKEREKEREKLAEAVKKRKAAREEALQMSTPWFIFVRSNVDMEDWYLSLVHASDNPANNPTLAPLRDVFRPADMTHLLSTLDSQPDVVPMRWLNALLGRIFFSYYRTQALENEIIRRLMKKLSKVKRPAFLTDIEVTEVAVGNKAPFFSKPMLKELTKEGDAALEVHLQYKGEIRITVEATATINLGARFKSYVVKLRLAAVLRELEGNLLIKVKRPPSSRIWYAFTQTPRMVLDVEPIVSDRQITWSMILNTIEAKMKEIIQESVVMPNMDDITFFESSSYQHRGGIWPDASRREKKSSVVDNPAPDATATLLDKATAALADEPKATALQRSQSAQNLNTESANAHPLPEVAPVVRSSTEGTPFEESPSLLSRRSSRHSSFVSVDGAALLQVPSNEHDTQRGRTTSGESMFFNRSRSTPRKRTSSRVSVNLTSGDGGEETRSTSHSTPQRSFSQRSSLRDSETSSISSNASIPTVPGPSGNPESPRAGPAAIASPVSSSTSFFSTLKSRAGDKQALSNSAKETMRKWGVSWGGLRKENANANASASVNTNAVHDDIPDQGSVDSRRGVDSNHTSLAHRARVSYAEVRAAVAERRGKDKEDGGRRSSTPTSEAEKGGPSANGTPVFTPSTIDSRHNSETSDVDVASPQILAPSISRVNTEPAGASTGLEGPELVPGDPLVQPSPIRAQPMQAKTMSIPGIHASHRGDIMSMGHVATPAPPPEGKPNPAIQSVYRLWKGPVISGQGTESASQSQPQDDSADGNKDIQPLSPPANSQAGTSPRPPPPPPPLPPRSVPTAVSRATRDHPQSSEVTTSASEVLKYIATKDEHTRVSLERSPPGDTSRRASTHAIGENGDGGTLAPNDTRAPKPGPPLPPRKVQPTA